MLTTAPLSTDDRAALLLALHFNALALGDLPRAESHYRRVLTLVEDPAVRRAGYEARAAAPGRFEGEPAWVPYFWDRLEDGEGQCDHTCEGRTSCDCPVVFAVTEAERAMFPELAEVWRVTVWEDEGQVLGAEVEA